MFLGQLKKRRTKRVGLVPSTRQTQTPRQRRVDNHYVYDSNGMRLTKTPRRHKPTSSRGRGISWLSSTEEPQIPG